MKDLSLDFASRLRLLNVISQATGPLGRLAPLHHVWGAIRFKDDESAVIKKTDDGNGTIRYEAPSPEFGSIQTQIENEYARALVRELDAYQNFRFTDLDWVQAVKDQLRD